MLFWLLAVPTAVLIGIYVQKRKGRTGVFWTIATLLLQLAAERYFITLAEPADLALPRGWVVVHAFSTLLPAALVFIAALTLPRRAPRT